VYKVSESDAESESESENAVYKKESYADITKYYKSNQNKPRCDKGKKTDGEGLGWVKMR
jgi:hypothetical protein